MKPAGTHVLFVMDENAAVHAAMLGARRRSDGFNDRIDFCNSLMIESGP